MCCVVKKILRFLTKSWIWTLWCPNAPLQLDCLIPAIKMLPPSGNSLTGAPLSFSLDWPLTSHGRQSASPKCFRLLCFLLANPVDMKEARLSTAQPLQRDCVVQRNALIDGQRYRRRTSSKPYWFMSTWRSWFFFFSIHWINPTNCGSEVLDGSR